MSTCHNKHNINIYSSTKSNSELPTTYYIILITRYYFNLKPCVNFNFDVSHHYLQSLFLPFDLWSILPKFGWIFFRTGSSIKPIHSTASFSELVPRSHIIRVYISTYAKNGTVKGPISEKIGVHIQGSTSKIWN